MGQPIDVTRWETALNESASHSLVQVLLSIHARCCVPAKRNYGSTSPTVSTLERAEGASSREVLSGEESNRLAPVCYRLPTGAFQPADLSRDTPVRVKWSKNRLNAAHA